MQIVRAKDTLYTREVIVVVIWGDFEGCHVSDYHRAVPDALVDARCRGLFDCVTARLTD